MARKKSEASVTEVSPENESLITKRENLIKDLQSKLLTNAQMTRGSSTIKSQHLKESGYQAVVDEINKISREIGLPEVSIGSLRK
jgi:hypothetical protein